MAKCEVCGGTDIRDETVDEVFHVNGHYQLVENIPARVCAQCGEKTFSRETAENVRKLLHGPIHPAHAISLDVFAYGMASSPPGSNVPNLGNAVGG